VSVVDSGATRGGPSAPWENVVAKDITIDDTVPVSVRPSIEGLVARLLPAYPHVRRVHVSFDESWIVTAWDGLGTSVVDDELVAAIRRALSTAEHH
jgi:hypothetical protein